MTTNPWNNFISQEELTETQLQELSLKSFPTAIMSAAVGTFKSSDQISNDRNEKMKMVSGSALTADDIENYSSFIIKTFYNVHMGHYPPSEIDVFKSQLPLFFSLPFHFIRHELDGNIVAYLAVCMLENHPFYKENTWHIGYWGISSNLTDRALRESIKNGWGTLLKNLNSQHRIAGNIDYFNKPAFKMASGFGMKVHGYRFDPRGE